MREGLCSFLDFHACKHGCYCFFLGYTAAEEDRCFGNITCILQPLATSRPNA